jgi:phosphohistidine phosphatase
MKTLYLVRHAKSSWKYKSLSDFERPLRKKGMDDLHAIIEVLKEKEVRPDFLVTSAAIRAVQTAVLLLQGLEMSQDSIGIKSSLYPGTCEQYLGCIKELPQEHHSVMLIGHHPAITEAINSLLEENLQRAATSSVHAIQWNEADRWEKCFDNPGQLLFAIKPKNL